MSVRQSARQTGESSHGWRRASHTENENTQKVEREEGGPKGGKQQEEEGRKKSRVELSWVETVASGKKKKSVREREKSRTWTVKAVKAQKNI